MSEQESIMLESTINSILNQLSGVTSLERFEDITTEIYSDIDEKFTSEEFSTNEKQLNILKDYQDKVSAIVRVFREKIIMDKNLSLIGADREYHLDFKTYSFDTQKIKEQINEYDREYIKYFYLVWLKLNYRISRSMDWDKLYSSPDNRQLSIYIDENISRNFTKLTDLEPSVFIKQAGKDYSQHENISITKQFLSKLIVSIESTGISIDKYKLAESFGHKYDQTIRTAYNKVNKEGNKFLKSFLNSFWNYLADDEKAVLISNFKKELESK